MKNYIKAFVATGIGMAMMNMVAEPEEKRTGVKVSSAPASMSSLMLSVASEDETKSWESHCYVLIFESSNLQFKLEGNIFFCRISQLLNNMVSKDRHKITFQLTINQTVLQG